MNSESEWPTLYVNGVTAYYINGDPMLSRVRIQLWDSNKLAANMVMQDRERLMNRFGMYVNLNFVPSGEELQLEKITRQSYGDSRAVLPVDETDKRAMCIDHLDVGKVDDGWMIEFGFLGREFKKHVAATAAPVSELAAIQHRTLNGLA